MAATVLNSDRAVEMSVFVVLAFVRMRRAIAGNRNVLMNKLAELGAPTRNARLRNPIVDRCDSRTDGARRAQIAGGSASKRQKARGARLSN